MPRNLRSSGLNTGVGRPRSTVYNAPPCQEEDLDHRSAAIELRRQPQQAGTLRGFVV